MKRSNLKARSALASILILASATVLQADEAAIDAGERLTPLYEVGHRPIEELSGMVRSKRYPDITWVHNDSGDSARIFALDGKGQIVMPEWRRKRHHGEKAELGKTPYPGLMLAGASNIDFEDITTDGERLYVADMGNNSNARRDLGFYVLDEPNPRSIDIARPWAFLAVRYPDQDSFPPADGDWRFDCEAVFCSEGRIFLLTKHRRGETGQMVAGTRLYRLDTPRPDRVSQLVWCGKHSELFAPTGADLSPSGETLAVLCLDAVWLFARPAVGHDWLSSPARKISLPMAQTMQAEAICFDDEDSLRLANEQRQVFRLDIRGLQPKPLPAPEAAPPEITEPGTEPSKESKPSAPEPPKPEAPSPKKPEPKKQPF